jgi:phosphoribosylglycinamide formyltransferase-1
MKEQGSKFYNLRTAINQQQSTISNQQSTIGNQQSAICDLVVLISGFGSNLQAILDACARGALLARVAAVISNKKDAYGLERARQAGVPAVYYPKFREQDRHAYDAGLADLVDSYRPAWIVLAGWMHVLSSAFLERFPNRVMNLHPALPGAFPGTEAIQRAFEAYQRGEIQHTGVMVHLVPDEGVDAGPVLAQEQVPIEPQDTLEILEARLHAVEHRLLVEVIIELTTEAHRTHSL